MKTKNVVLALAVGIMFCLLVISPLIQATVPTPVVTTDNLILLDAFGNIVGVNGLNTTIVYCTAINELTSGQGVKLYRLVVENGSSFPSSPLDKQLFYLTTTDCLYIYDSSVWNPVGAAPTTYPYANITGVPDLSSLLAQNGSRPLLNNWNTGSYGIYGLTYVSTVGTVYCSGLSNVTLAGYVNTTRLLVETSASAPASPSKGYVYFDTAQNNLFIYNGTGWMALGNATAGTTPDLTVYLFNNGTRPLTANWNVGAFGLYGMTWVNTTSLNIAGQLWWNGYNRTDIIAHPQDSFNFLVYSEGGATYSRTGNTWQVAPSTIQACVDAVTSSGGSIIVKNGTYSEAVSLKNATRLVLDRGCVGVTVTIASGATAILEDYNSAITWVWSSGVLVMQYNNINGLITGIYANFNQYWSGAYNRTDALVNPFAPYSYIIDLSGTTYRMRNGTTGQIDFQSTNLTLVEQFASANLTSGLIYLKELQWNTSLGSPADNIMIVQQYQGEIRYISSQAKFVIPQLGADPNTIGWTSTERGRIWHNTGEDAVKYWNGSAIVIMSSIGGGSTSSYTLPYSYMIYKSGSTYYAESSTGTILSSSTNASQVINNAIGNCTWAQPSTIVCKGYITLTNTINITPNSWINFQFESFYVSADVDGIIVGGSSASWWAGWIKGNVIYYPNGYTHKVVTFKNLAGYGVCHINYITCLSGSSGANSAGYYLLGDATGCGWHNIYDTSIQGLATGILLESLNSGWVSSNHFYGLKLLTQTSCGVKTASTGGQVSGNIFSSVEASAFGSGTYGFYFNGTFNPYACYNRLEECDVIDFTGTATALYVNATTMAMELDVFGGQFYWASLGHYTIAGLGTLKMDHVNGFVTANSGSWSGTSPVTVAHGCAGTPYVQLTVNAAQPYTVSCTVNATYIVIYHNGLDSISGWWTAEYRP